MPDFEQSYQKIVDTAIERALHKYIDQLRQFIKKDRLLTIPELAEYSGYSKNRIYGFIRRNYDPLPAYRIEKDYRISLPEFSEWIEKYRVGFKGRKKRIVDPGVRK